MRADGKDQAEWTERRRRRLRVGGGGNKPSRAMTTRSTSSKTPKSEKCHHNRRRLQQRRGKEEHKTASSGDKNKKIPSEAPSPTEATIRVGQLKSTLAKAPDPPAVAAELATLYLVLSDLRGALKSFQLAVRPSPGERHFKETTWNNNMHYCCGDNVAYCCTSTYPVAEQ